MNAGELDDSVDCIVLGPCSSLDSPPVRDALTDRGWSARAIGDVYLAMAELCLEVKARTTRAAWGLSGSQTLHLLLASSGGSTEGGTEDQRRRLVRAVQRTFPDVAVMEVVGGRLQTIDPLEVDHGRSAPERDPGRSPHSTDEHAPAPDGPIAGQIGHHLRSDLPREVEHESEDEDRAPSRDEEGSAITPDELAMLFESDRANSEQER